MRVPGYWPKPPIWPEDLALIAELLASEHAETAQADGSGIAERPAAGLSAGIWRAEHELKAPNEITSRTSR